MTKNIFTFKKKMNSFMDRHSNYPVCHTQLYIFFDRLVRGPTDNMLKRKEDCESIRRSSNREP